MMFLFVIKRLDRAESQALLHAKLLEIADPAAVAPLIVQLVERLVVARFLG